MPILILIFKYLVCIAAMLALSGYIFMVFHPVFGGKPDAQSLVKIQRSPNFNGKKFINLEETTIQTGEEEISLWQWTKDKLIASSHNTPRQALPSVPLNLSLFRDGSVVWFGHSTVLFQTHGKRLITDPVYYHASPLPFVVEPFKMQHTPTVEELSALDAVLISHDHYDHLDYKTILQIDAKTQRFIVPLGVKAHLQRWGVASEKITELDWDESVNLDGVEITLVPSRHFSGRALNTQDSTLWGGYVVKSPDLSLYFSADTGYGSHFVERVAKYAPFDFVMIENGAYNDKWALIHEFPEQAVQAVRDVQGTKVMPIHWGKFDLSEHHWTEPVKRFLADAKQYNLQVATPKIGEVFHIFEPLPHEKWWEKVK
ncbi:hypothetical protein F542_21070 [Bibersteinia trehalosi USDA-ARS-USMARC-188]|uniref:Metallo-beta-lactamase domain-containing protein n=4 Tax=Bibersteinia trehalosi TaxID=47735 RepID=W0R2E8_BIBTR|nr:MBL fold metallo-hydrolase [Bibersteinia trehalosi]AGH37337.1 hypothetical protein WQG_500 [Bibersteinia trehalosi USDA-ARS-USMARC-192]AHG82815.1 hypothetical protein F542_21070 [Bibersteinia trehalosi USDA-ARS-USMARC-188]AHG85189.1 hypothetical protein F543_23350 [Bibersteinia trehalosi USDA-ARS-USMARC-189]AHG85289.1 hypothetical protein F544_520 [Bibersteinia trehalosi USDA-ARS-USMARC-190]OAQ13934.1 multidrug transporter [Bibersteinia trehalosi Y31]